MSRKSTNRRQIALETVEPPPGAILELRATEPLWVGPVWEYRREVLVEGVDPVEESLGRLGREGWEFCGVLWPRRVAWRPETTEGSPAAPVEHRAGLVCLFKRRVGG